MSADLATLRAEHLAAWSRDTHLSDWPIVANTASSKYVPALEAEVDRLRALRGEPPLVEEPERTGRPVLVHFGSELTDVGLITAEETTEVPGGKWRANGPEVERSYYIVGQHFGTWLPEKRRGDVTAAVWFEECEATDEHRLLAERVDVLVEPFGGER